MANNQLKQQKVEKNNDDAKLIMNWRNDPITLVNSFRILRFEWNEFKELDLKKIKDIMTRPIIVDYRNIFSLKEMEDLNFEYHSVGRNTINTK
mgnify:CR=1 FL=1